LSSGPRRRKKPAALSPHAEGYIGEPVEPPANLPARSPPQPAAVYAFVFPFIACRRAGKAGIDGLRKSEPAE
jgi:hypothetical protein